MSSNDQIVKAALDHVFLATVALETGQAAEAQAHATIAGALAQLTTPLVVAPTRPGASNATQMGDPRALAIGEWTADIQVLGMPEPKILDDRPVEPAGPTPPGSPRRLQTPRR